MNEFDQMVVNFFFGTIVAEALEELFSNTEAMAGPGNQSSNLKCKDLGVPSTELKPASGQIEPSLGTVQLLQQGFH
ncbi:hypothetical protein D3C79_1064060 [compost metagenome]